MKRSTTLKRNTIIALIFAAYASVYLSGCIVDRDHDDHHDDHHDFHDDHAHDHDHDHP